MEGEEEMKFEEVDKAIRKLKKGKATGEEELRRGGFRGDL